MDCKYGTDVRQPWFFEGRGRRGHSDGFGLRCLGPPYGGATTPDRLKAQLPAWDRLTAELQTRTALAGLCSGGVIVLFAELLHV